MESKLLLRDTRSTLYLSYNSIVEGYKQIVDKRIQIERKIYFLDKGEQGFLRELNELYAKIFAIEKSLENALNGIIKELRNFEYKGE